MVQIREHKRFLVTQRAPRAQNRRAMARMVALKMVVLVIPKGAEEKAMLEEDVKRMGCHGLMLRPWSIKYEKIVLEL